MIQNSRKYNNRWLQIWEKKGRELKSSKIENLIDANGHNTKFGEFKKKNWNKYIKSILKNIKIKKGSQILEYGCGAGAFLSYWYEKKYYLNGIDYSKTLITKGKKYFPKINFKVGEISSLDSFNKKFDLIFSHSVFQYFKNYKYAEKLILKMLTKLKYKGYICILDIPDKEKENLYIKRLKKEMGKNEYEKKYKKNKHFFYEKTFFKRLAIENNLEFKIFKHNSEFNKNSKYRYNLILRFK